MAGDTGGHLVEIIKAMPQIYMYPIHYYVTYTTIRIWEASRFTSMPRCGGGANGGSDGCV